MKPTRSVKYFLGVAAMFWGVAQTMPATAGTLNLSDIPLFLGNNSQPNVVFVIDDSGSMDWEFMTPDAFNGGRFSGSQPDGSEPSEAGPVKHRDGDNDGLANCSFGNSGVCDDAGQCGTQSSYGYMYIVEFGDNGRSDDGYDCNTADDQAWRARNSDFNPLYFDPTKTYTPWIGFDVAGNLFTDMDIHSAKANPFDPNSETIDLTIHNSDWLGGTLRATSDRNGDGLPDGFRYYTWADLDGDGLFDNGEETEHFIKDADAEAQQNFANWFSYYRRREFVAKAAYGQVIAEINGVRMGLVTLHNNIRLQNTAGDLEINTPVEAVDADFTTGHKRALLDALYNGNAVNGTPLRRALQNVGEYLECNAANGLFTTCPALPETDGGACQQNFVIMMTDGFRNGAVPNPSVGNADGNNSTSFDGGAYADAFSDTLADVAMYFYERDLHPSLSNNVPVVTGVDEASHQHMVTYTVSFGLKGTLDNSPTDPSLAFLWPDPDGSSSLARVDDLRHAAYNGRGLYLEASNPDELVESLKDVLASIASRTSSAASVALNSGSLSTESVAYQARFNSDNWSGQLLAFPIEDGELLPSTWDAGVEIDEQHFDTGRKILTYHAGTKNGIPFRWTNLDTTQKDALHTNKGGTNDGQGEDRLKYLRGARVHEGAGNNYRLRTHVLGDIVSSDPFYVGPPAFPDELGSGYAAFRDANPSRQPMIFAGANDGFLHILDANTGQELLAYAPMTIFDRLSHLTAPSYNHRYYVDGSPTVLDVFANLHGGAEAWRTVAVGGLRAGGQGFYALDVTDPTSFSEGNAANIVLWEFSDADDADLGFSYSQPSIIRMANNRWAAIFGNGYNSTVADSNASTTGHAVLFIVFLDGGLDGVWTEGTDYIKLDTQAGSLTAPNGLSIPVVVDRDGDFTADYVVAGDVLGNVWTFNVTDSNAGLWASQYSSGSTPAPLFTATDGSIRQPITSQPEVGEHPTQPETGFVVYVGTGKYLEDIDRDPIGAPTQTFYGIWDKLAGTAPSISRGDLLEQTVEVVTTVASLPVRVTSDNEIDWDTQQGWFLDLPVEGERQVSDPVLRDDNIIFTTLIPNADPCEYGGTSWLMELDFRGGRRPESAPFDLNGDGLFNEDDYVELPDGTKVPASGLGSGDAGILSRPTFIYAGSHDFGFSSASSGAVFQVRRNSPGVRGRVSWRQNL